ncbi:hypothetical protein [Saccharopolyspora sp. NPDC002376]
MTVPYPLRDPGPWWNVFERDSVRPDTFYSIDHIPFRRSEKESQDDLAAWGNEVPHALLGVSEFDVLWHARCVVCGTPMDDEDYLYVEWDEVAHLAANEKSEWVADLEKRLIWCAGCHHQNTHGGGA